MSTVRLSVTLCIVALSLRVGLQSEKFYQRVLRKFLLVTSDTCCSVYRLATECTENE